MSRIANAPIAIPKGVETTLSDSVISVKGSKGNLQLDLHELVGVAQDGDALKVSAKDESRQAGGNFSFTHQQHGCGCQRRVSA